MRRHVDPAVSSTRFICDNYFVNDYHPQVKFVLFHLFVLTEYLTMPLDFAADEGPSNLIAEAKRLGANLRTPEKAKIARERKLQTNPAGKSRSTRGQSDPKLSSWQRVQEHKNEYLTSVDGKLRCDACKETISKKKSTVKKHISSLKHVKAKKTILESMNKDQSVLELLRRNDQAKHPK